MNRRKNGYSLIELMVGVFIISIGALALYQMFVVGSQMITEEYHRRLGLERAQALMESCNYFTTQGQEVPTAMAGTYIEDLIPGAGYNDDSRIQSVYTISVAPCSDFFPHSDRHVYSRVAIDYSWVEKSGHEQKITLQSYF